MEITFSALLSFQEIIVSSKIKNKIKNHIPCKPIGLKTRNTRWPIGVKTSAWRNTPVPKLKLERYYKVQHMHVCVWYVCVCVCVVSERGRELVYNNSRLSSRKPRLSNAAKPPRIIWSCFHMMNELSHIKMPCNYF